MTHSAIVYTTFGIPVDGSTNRRNEIILGGHYNYQIR